MVNREVFNIIQRIIFSSISRCNIFKEYRRCFFFAAEEVGLKEGDVINNQWVNNFVKKFLNSDVVKNLLSSSRKPNKDKKDKQ